MSRYLYIAIGGAAGALARYGVATLIQARVPSTFPWGTFVVNVSGCFLLGVLAGAMLHRLPEFPRAWFMLAVGFLGAYTTFSTFELETFRAVQARAFIAAGANVLASVVAGFLALWLGIALGRLFD